MYVAKMIDTRKWIWALGCISAFVQSPLALSA